MLNVRGASTYLSDATLYYYFCTIVTGEESHINLCYFQGRKRGRGKDAEIGGDGERDVS